jgi:hypothetical protein
MQAGGRRINQQWDASPARTLSELAWSVPHSVLPRRRRPRDAVLVLSSVAAVVSNARFSIAAEGRPGGRMTRSQRDEVFMRFSIRDVLWLTLVVGLVGALLIERYERRNERLVTVNWTSEEEQEWAKEKFQAAKSAFEQLKSYTRGNLSWIDQCDIIERYARTAEELPADPETRLKELEAALAYARELEATTKEKYDAEVEPLMYLNRTQYTRADVETRLKRVQREFVVAKSQR